MTIWIATLMFIAMVCPNTLKVLRRFEPALGVKPHSTEGGLGRIVAWNGSVPWAILAAALASAAISSLDSPSEFLYWQF
jgi:hypothetical protein